MVKILKINSSSNSNSNPSMSKLASSPLLPFLSCLVLVVCTLPQISNAQSPTRATTDPSEVRALNSLFQQWDVQVPSGLWNISGEPCSGTAINKTALDINPSIKCNCSYDSNTTCHITELKVNGLNKEGVFPEDLAALPHLKILTVDQNSMTGTLPAFIGNLSALVVLYVSHNKLSGPIPKELGNLKELEYLALSSNNFSGTLPPELGNLVKLKQVYLDSCGVGGEIPPTFANLQEMIVWWASDSPFTGKIPNFIGNWTKLQKLRLQGNNFEGPIPSSFSNLISLDSLRVSDLQNVSSSLDFIKNLRNLTDLILRNALISGSIPSDIIALQHLQTLDLSFNNLSGPIPRTIMNLTSLTSLFLGNNSLTGNLLPEKRESLKHIDLSYNHLSGDFPSWVILNWENQQLSLVANNFKFDSTNITFPGLVCLQRDFPCNKNSTPYSSFAIKCGGSEVRSNNGIVYETEDSTTLGPASYYVYAEKWAVSNGGVDIDREDPTFIATTTARVANTNTPVLFRTARISPSSLRYYGLGLENGPYTVSLLFAEILFNKSNQVWKGHGRRIFDIYIQGSLRQKDFDISKEAGGIERALTKNFKANVTQNYLEIHLFWAGKGTCCIPEEGNYGPSISALSVSPDFKIRRKSKSKSGMIGGIVVAVAVSSLVFIAVFLYWKRRGSKHDEEEAILGMGPKVKTYSYAELKTATGDFNASNMLGEGGFGPVYKGTLYDGRVVAVKQLSVASDHGKTQFVTEISTISAVQHWNLVKLYGCCIEGSKKLLVYEYLENSSLDQSLFGKKKLLLDWPQRFNICLGTAKGLAYLHEESRPRIVHRDVKASNILLDAELCPKISDFGLAKLYDDKKTHISTRVAGTIGYLAPEYAMRGHLTSKADVFGYGVVCLEIVSGRPNYDDSLDPENKFLLQQAWSLYESNRSLELVDPTLTAFDKREAARIIGVALLCVQASPTLRPPMSRVIAMLSGDREVTAVTTKPSYLTDWDFNDVTNNYLDEEPLKSNTSSTIVDSEYITPVNMTKMLNETLTEGR